MRITLQLIFVFTVIIFLGSCAGYRTRYSREATHWQSEVPDTSLVLKHTMYLIGDAGNDSPEHPAPVLEYLKAKLATEPKGSSALFMGDNIYEYGMPPSEDSATRKVAEYRINSQLETLDDFKGYPIFLPGNHDWRGWGVKGVKRQEKYIQQYLNSRRSKTDKEDYENYFLPLNGCSGPEVVEMNDNVVVIVVDSQWWLTDWDKDQKINEGCEIRNREHFRFIFENVLRKYRNKNVVIAMHHPPFTYGPHGGKFTIKQHLFPLTEINPKLFIPLPVIGSMSAIFRATIGSRQDVANKHYRDLRAAILAGAKKNGNFIFASGHEHTLQFIENEGQEFIVSGSGSKNSPVGMGKGSQFATTSLGFSTLSFYEGGETWVKYWEVSKDRKDAKVIYQKRVKDKLITHLPDPKTGFAEYEQHADSSSQFVSKTEVKPVGKFHSFLFGSHNRHLYLEKYPFPVMDLSSNHGGLTVVKQGGGNQTNSLRLRSIDGKEYVLRGLTKDVTRFLPAPFNKMPAAKYVVEDNFLSTNPFAPLSMPVMADAIHIYHTNPKLYYVPAQPGLGTYNAVFGGTMNLFEERPDGKKWKNDSFFGNADKIVSTPEVVESILEDAKNKVDEPWMLRTRLFDFLIGDWDRHDDQWAWASIKQKDDTKLFRPIPRDRDQAFSLYDGLVTDVARQTLPFLRQLQSFNPKIKSMKWTTWSARMIDRTFLNGLSWEQWQEQVKFIQTSLTDEVINSAFSAWPEKARETASPSIIKSIKTRRDDLMEIARKHYAFLGKSVNVLGTDNRDRFVVDRIDDEHTRVTVYEISKKGKIRQQFYQRTFGSDITKIINLYGNADEDEFVIQGDVKKGITVRIIGGTGEDVVTDSSNVRSAGKKTIVYDDLKGNTITAGLVTKDKRTTDYGYNTYERRSADSNYDITLPIPIAGFNPDDGVFLGANVSLTKYGFKKDPYASIQTFGGSFAFHTKAFKVNYTGDFIGTFKKLDFYLDTYYHGPTYAFNYAGLGNESVRPVDDPNFYRVRQSAVHVFPAVKKRFAGNSGFIALGPFADVSKLQETPGRFITSAENQLDKGIFQTKYFTGARLLFDFSSVDNQASPHSGFKFNSGLNWTVNLKSNASFATWRAQFSYYTALDTKENIILATQIGTGVNFGEGYEFFQMPTIGGKQGLRGYRTERFYGQSSLWHDTDLRIRLGNSQNPALPLTYGLFTSFDYGRVWLEDHLSDDWHFNYGGGIWLAPVDMITIAVGTFIPKEKTEEKPRISFQLGFWF